jgi:hypothetical protein
MPRRYGRTLGKAYFYRARAAIAASVAALFFGSLAAAAETPSPARIVYTTDDTAADCLDEHAFVTAVAERLRQGRLAAPGEAAREFRVHVRRIGERHAARLDFVEADGTPRAREVGAAGCAEVARAIALVTALAIDDARAEEPASGSEGLLSPSEAVGLVESSPAPPTTPATPATAPVAPPPIPPDAEPRFVRRQKSSVPLGLDVGVAATVTQSKAPEVLPGIELFATLHDRDESWLVELGASGERGWAVARAAGSARFSFAGARLRGCAPSLHLGVGWTVSPCAVVEAGALIAEGIILHPQTRVEGWVALGPAVRLAYGTDLGAVHLEAGPIFPTNRDHFIFGPGEAVYNVPAAGAYVKLGGSLRIF